MVVGPMVVVGAPGAQYGMVVVCGGESVVMGGGGVAGGGGVVAGGGGPQPLSQVPLQQWSPDAPANCPCKLVILVLMVSRVSATSVSFATRRRSVSAATAASTA